MLMTKLLFLMDKRVVVTFLELEDWVCSSSQRMKEKQDIMITETGTWEELPGSYRVTVRDGIRMAQKLAPMDIMMLPVVYRGEAS